MCRCLGGTWSVSTTELWFWLRSGSGWTGEFLLLMEGFKSSASLKVFLLQLEVQRGLRVHEEAADQPEPHV